MRIDSGKQCSILVDGYNLGLEKGTGVATYGRVLSQIVRSIGFRSFVVFGGRGKASANPLLNEVAFFERRFAKRTFLLDALDFPYSFFASHGNRVDKIEISGTVIFDAIKDKLPEFDELANSRNLFRRSISSFRWTGRFGQVSVPGLDIAHWTYPLPVKAHNTANIYTLHDLVPLRLPFTTLDNKRRYYKLCKTLVDTADHIVTVSECSRNDIINILGADPNKVTNTYQAISFPPEALAKTDDVVRDELRGIYKLGFKEYFLFFGALEPKKNVGRLVEAYLASNVTTPLVIVGAPGWKSEDELKLLGNPKTGATLAAVKERIIRLEYLPLSMLVSLIRGAKATLFPSLYEGFGLPVLESMTLGTAVLTSDTSSLPEIAGDAACLVNPYDTQAIVEGIRALDRNDDWRQDLESRGREQAERFSMAAYAKRVDALYRQVLAERAVRR